VQTIRQLVPLRNALAIYRAEGERIALVPTMGALHAGHIALVDAAKLVADKVIVTIFVNPKQFGPLEDLARYPRRELADARMLAESGCALLWMPSRAEMYPEGFATNITVADVSEQMDGAARPGHFDGVATVVAKLFNQVCPDVAVFGEKDFQQLAVIRRMTLDLDFRTEIIGVPTQREDDGLAMSSRNAYLTGADRARAVALPRALGEAARALGNGAGVTAVLASAREALLMGGFDSVDYVELVDAETLQSAVVPGRPARLLAAAHLGGTRLIDNIAITISK